MTARTGVCIVKCVRNAVLVVSPMSLDTHTRAHFSMYMHTHTCRYGPEVDTWSCGVVLYILLSGTQPFGEGNNGRNSNLVEQIKKAQFTFPSAQWGMISTGAKEMIKKILKAEPSQRMTLSQIMQDPWFKQGLSHPSPSTAMDTSLSLPDPHPAFSPPKNNHAHSIHLACSSSMDQSVSNGQLATTSSLRHIDSPSLPAQQQQQQQHASKRAKHSDTGNVDFSAFMADQDTTTPTEYKVPGEHGGSGNKRKR
jgi:serine/threonine protein kinase